MLSLVALTKLFLPDKTSIHLDSLPILANFLALAYGFSFEFLMLLFKSAASFLFLSKVSSTPSWYKNFLKISCLLFMERAISSAFLCWTSVRWSLKSTGKFASNKAFFISWTYLYAIMVIFENHLWCSVWLLLGSSNCSCSLFITPRSPTWRPSIPIPAVLVLSAS